MNSIIMFSANQQMKFRTNGPRAIGLSGTTVYSNINNKLAHVNGANPPTFYPADKGYGGYANSRKTYIKDGGGGQGYHDASQVTQLRRITAVGKASTQHQTQLITGFSYGGPDPSFTRSARQRTRNGGCTAPKKKSALENPYKSGGSSILTSVGNRQVNAP